MKHAPGYQRIGHRSYFTLYAPYAASVSLAVFDACQDKKPKQSMPMRKIFDGWWEYSDIESFEGLYYAFKIDGQPEYIADPYARSLATFNDYRQDARAYIDHSVFEWEGDSFIRISDPRDLLIYECHIKDLSAHPASGSSYPGTYAAAIERIPYLKTLGVNAVEFMPLMLFANHEPPYKKETQNVFNDWNPYAYNYWGYMTSYFFAPANIYTQGVKREAGSWCDPRGKDVHALKTLIKALHKAGIAVIMDVVYNHISQYNINPLRELAADHYLRPHENHSGCGNDSNSESPVMRNLILDSVRYWMKEYHIDGFRFDLTGILDDDILSEIRRETKALNSGAVLLGEPWGKRYFPERMSELGFGVWNDRYRNTIKGENPFDARGLIFAEETADEFPKQLFSCLSGSLQRDGGLVGDSQRTLNYLESHDGYTLGDFIRITVRKNGTKALPDHEKHVKLSPEEENLHRICAFILFCSQGIPMMQAGQEFARSKVIAKVPGIEDPHVGELDPDSYSKDNETNYIDFRDKEINGSLFEYYRQLISMRSHFPELRSTGRDKISAIYASDNLHAAGYRIDTDKRHMAVLINLSETEDAVFELKIKRWKVHADLEQASAEPLYEKGEGSAVKLKARSAILLVR